MQDMTILNTLVILFAGGAVYAAARYIIGLYGRRMNVKFRRQQTLQRVIMAAVGICITVLLTILWGFDIRGALPVITGFLGFFGIALFAAWSHLSNVVSSFILYFTMPYRSGDHITIHDGETVIDGTIEEMALFHVFVTDDAGNTAIIPNNLTMQKMIVRRKRTHAPDDPPPLA